MTANDLSAHDMVSVLLDRGIDPDAVFESPAGRDAGYVDVWRLPDGVSVMQWWDGAVIEYEIIRLRDLEWTDLRIDPP